MGGSARSGSLRPCRDDCIDKDHNGRYALNEDDNGPVINREAIDVSIRMLGRLP